MKIHIVRSKDTLSDLAKKYNVPVERILESNSDIQAEQPLQTGEKICVPTGKVSLTKVAKERNDHDRNHETNESSAYGWESSTHPSQHAYESYYPMQAESHFAENFPYPPMPPSAAWEPSYHMLPANSYLPHGQVSGVPMSPCYYPYPMVPYHFDPYQQMQPSYHPSYDYHDYWEEESEQGDLWSAKESSSVEG